MKTPTDVAAENKRERYKALLIHRIEKSNGAFAEHVGRLIGMLPKKLTDQLPKISPPHSNISIARFPPESQSGNH